jgi:hypothetical protein
MRIFLVVLLGFVLSVAVFAQPVAAQKTTNPERVDPNLGTWKLNLERSTYKPGPAPKSEIAAFRQVGPEIKLTVDRIDANEKPVHIEWSGKFDGNFYPSSSVALIGVTCRLRLRRNLSPVDRSTAAYTERTLWLAATWRQIPSAGLDV